MHHQAERRIIIQNPWQISGVGAISSRTKPKLADKYKTIAETAFNAEVVSIKKLIEEKVSIWASKGKRTINWYPAPSELQYKEAISNWLRDERFNFEWKTEQREGTWVVLSW